MITWLCQFFQTKPVTTKNSVYYDEYAKKIGLLRRDGESDSELKRRIILRRVELREIKRERPN